jgi:hypothetical protein
MNPKTMTPSTDSEQNGMENSSVNSNHCSALCFSDTDIAREDAVIADCCLKFLLHPWISMALSQIDPI